MDKEKRRAYERKRYHENIERYKAYANKWRKKNKDKIKVYTKKYYDAHREEQLEKHRIDRLNNLEKRRKEDRDYGKTLRGRFKCYKSGAKQRNIEFSLTFEEFEKYWNNKCYYCEEKIDGVGIDRVDNSIGYLNDNIVACCGICNKMKLTMTKDMFINKCKIIYEKHK